MPIYNIVDGQKHKVEVLAPKIEQPPMEDIKEKQKWFSSLIARSFFLLLLLADMGWSCYSFFRLWVWGTIHLFTFGKVEFFRHKMNKACISLKRSLICGVSLFVAVFSPSIGIMIACTYFLMHDPTGIEEVVPASLQTQFREFFL